MLKNGGGGIGGCTGELLRSLGWGSGGMGEWNEWVRVGAPCGVSMWGSNLNNNIIMMVVFERRVER